MVVLLLYLTIIPRARMGSESKAHEAELTQRNERNNCFSKIQLVGKNIQNENILVS